MEGSRPGRAPLRARGAALAAGCALVLGGSGAAGQAPIREASDLAQRVQAVRDGGVRFRFATDPEVLVCTQGIHRSAWHDLQVDRRERCSVGSGEALLTVRDGRVERIRLRPPGSPFPDAEPETDLGAVAPATAAAFLLDLAGSAAGEGGQGARASERAARDALVPAVVADGVEVWPRLLELGRERALPGAVRRAAVFWLGQEAAEAATRGLAGLAEDEREEGRVRKAAVFALSQRPRGEGVPYLMELSREARDPEVRRSALFWLAQSDDPRVLPFFEAILRMASPTPPL